MISRQCPVRVAVAGFVVVAVAVAAWSAPILDSDPAKLNLQERSLTKVQSVRVIIHPLNELLVKEGVDPLKIKADWVETLRESGFEVSEEGKGRPVLVVTVDVAFDEALPDAIAIAPMLAVFQEVVIQRTGEVVKVPTYAHKMVGLFKTSQVGQSVDMALDSLLGSFIETCRRADQAKK